MPGQARHDKMCIRDSLDAVHAYATEGEICGVLREVFGEYQENVVL